MVLINRMLCFAIKTILLTTDVCYMYTNLYIQVYLWLYPFNYFGGDESVRDRYDCRIVSLLLSMKGTFCVMSQDLPEIR